MAVFPAEQPSSLWIICRVSGKVFSRAVGKEHLTVGQLKKIRHKESCRKEIQLKEIRLAGSRR